MGRISQLSILFLICLNALSLFGQPIPTEVDTARVRDLFKKTNNAIRQADMALAQNYVDIASRYIESLGLGLDFTAMNEYNQAVIYFQTGRIQESYEVFNNCYQNRLENQGLVNDHTLTALAAMAATAGMLGKIEEALEANLTSIKGYRQLAGSKPMALAIPHYNAMDMYLILGDYVRADSMIRVCKDIVEQHYGTESQEYVPALRGLGKVYQRVSYHQAATEYFRAALDLQLKTRGWFGNLSELYNDVASTLSAQRRYDEALEYLRFALNYNENHFGTMNESQGVILTELGRNYGFLNKYEEAEDYYLKAIKVLEVVYTPRHFFIGQIYDYMGSLYSRQDKDEQAEKVYQKAIGIFLEDAGTNRDRLSFCYRGMFYLNLKKGLLKEAEEYLNLAISNDVYREATNNLHTTLNQRALADLHLHTGNDSLALAYVHQALVNLVDGFESTNPWDPTPIHISNTYRSLIGCLENKAGIFEEIYQKNQELPYLEGAFSSMMEVCEVIKISTYDIENTQSKSSVLRKDFIFFEKAIELAWGLYDQTNNPTYLHHLWDLTEESRSMTLKQSLHESDIRYKTGIPIEMLEFGDSIKQKLALLEFQLYSTDRDKNSAIVQSLQNQIVEYKRKLDVWVLNLEQNYPEYFQLKYQPDRIRHSQILRALDRQQAMISFSLANGTWYRLSLNKQGLQADTLKLSEDSLTILVEAFLKSIREQDPAFESYSSQLFEALFGNLEILDNVEELIILPDGPLSRIPFDILVKDPNQQEQKYLLNSHRILCNYSAKLWLDSKHHRSIPTAKPLLAMVPETSTNPALIAQLDETFRDVVRPLIGAIKEGQNISKIMGGDLIQGYEATESAFKSKARDYQILHLATHGVLDDRSPLLSRLVLNPDTLGTDSTTTLLDDGYLHTYELFDLDLSAQLVTLSACNTGIGEYIRGEGAMSLARGFAYAGCPNVLMSLWPVPDEATAKIMDQFYKGLAEGLPKDEALRKAKLHYLHWHPDSRTAPYYWGGWVLMGEGAPLQQKSTQPFMLALLALIAIGLGMGMTFEHYSKN